VLPDLRDLRETLVLRVLPDLRVQLVIQVHRVLLVIPDLKDLKA
jgi:hypothetical protein